MVTTDLKDFGQRELKLLEQLLRAMREQGLPENFTKDEVLPHFNQNSGYVFLGNSEYQAAMMNGDTLELWHNCNYCGHEGFLEDFEHDPIDESCIENMEWTGIPKESIKSSVVIGNGE